MNAPITFWAGISFIILGGIFSQIKMQEIAVSFIVAALVSLVVCFIIYMAD